MEKSPSLEAYCHSTSQEIPQLLGNPEAHYRIHESPLLVPILRQLHIHFHLPRSFQKNPSNSEALCNIS